jgi:ribosomal protein S14
LPKTCAFSGRFSGIGSSPALARICFRRNAARSSHASRVAKTGIL